MSPEVRKAALRAAAKVAIVFSLGGCGAPAASTPTPAPPPDRGGGATQAPPPASVPCGTYLDGLALAANSAALPENDPLHGRPDVYGQPFADQTARSAPRTQECCTAELTADGANAAHRWSCCSAVPETHAVVMACTPWGPPCPPEMTA